MQTITSVTIGAMSTMVIIELLLVLYYFRKTKRISSELQKKKLENANLDAMLQASELRVSAEKKTSEERRKLINDLTFAARGVRGEK